MDMDMDMRVTRGPQPCSPQLRRQGCGVEGRAKMLPAPWPACPERAAARGEQRWSPLAPATNGGRGVQGGGSCSRERARDEWMGKGSESERGRERGVIVVLGRARGQAHHLPRGLRRIG
eukprot:6050825-Prymnesium_polylepis.3